jgi:CheY-like chemotaxis protein
VFFSGECKRFSLVKDGGKTVLKSVSAERQKPVVLHIEDDDAAAYLFRLMLRQHGADIDLFRLCNGEDGILFLTRSGLFADAPRPAVIVLDLQIPKKNGHDVLAECRQQGDLQNTPVIMFSSSILPADKERAFTLGANGYIRKSPDLKSYAEVAAQVMRYISRKPFSASSD